MAPLPPNSTQRYFFDYATCGFDHTLVMRAIGDRDDEAAVEFLVSILDAIHDLIFEYTVLGWRYQADTSDVSVDLAWTGAATYGGSAGVAYQTAQYIDFVGRSADGRRVRAAFFGTTFAEQGNDYRVSPAEQPAVGDVVGLLDASTNYFNTISGELANWKNYANTGVNAYWRNKVR
jgi:hypothetical protein